MVGYKDDVHSALLNALRSLKEKTIGAATDTCPHTDFLFPVNSNGNVRIFVHGKEVGVDIPIKGGAARFILDGWMASVDQVAAKFGYHPREIVRLLRSMENAGETMDAEKERRQREAERILDEYRSFVSEIEDWANR